MKYLFIIISIALLSSCKSQKYYHRAKADWEDLRRLIKEHPDLADSFKLAKSDTTKVTPVKDEINADSNPNTWDATFMGSVDSTASDLVKAPIIEKPQIATKLQDKICPTLNKDTTYHFRIYNSEISIDHTLHVRAQAKGGKLSFLIDMPDLKVPETRVMTEIWFKPLYEQVTFYKDHWFWCFMGSLLFILILLIVIIRMK